MPHLVDVKPRRALSRVEARFVRAGEFRSSFFSMDCSGLRETLPMLTRAVDLAIAATACGTSYPCRTRHLPYNSWIAHRTTSPRQTKSKDRAATAYG